MTGGQAQNRIWIDTDDFIRMFDWAITPTGIGRVQMELVPELVRAFPDKVRLFRVSRNGKPAVVVEPEEITRLVRSADFVLANGRERRSLVRVVQFLRFSARRAKAKLESLTGNAPARRFASEVRPGDLIVNFGASWEHPGYGKEIRALKKQYGLRFAILVHDILPVTHPQFVSPSHIPNFKRWLAEMAGLWDMVLTPSKASAQALVRYLEATGLPVPPVTPIPFGAGFRSLDSNPDATLPVKEPYVLFVSTIEVRKNHLLLVRIWKRLIEKHGAAKVPALVFAGKLGWEIDALRAELAATNDLGGKVKVLEYLSDAEIRAAYDGCLFTAFPSLCEGWGLPVSESLSHGKFCVASNATSIPEAGGPFADYFDPADEEEAFRLIERAVFDTQYRQAREDEIANRFRRTTWGDTAAEVAALLSEPARGEIPFVLS